MKFYLEKPEGQIGSEARIVVKDETGEVVFIQPVPSGLEGNADYIKATCAQICAILAQTPPRKPERTEIVI